MISYLVAAFNNIKSKDALIYYIKMVKSHLDHLVIQKSFTVQNIYARLNFLFSISLSSNQTFEIILELFKQFSGLLFSERIHKSE